MLQTILLPVDGSDSSQRAVSFASDLAAETPTSILLLHVLDNVPSRQQLLDYLVVLERNPAANEAEIEEIRTALSQSGEEQGNEILANAEQFLKGKGVNDVSTAIQDGDPASVILRLSESGKYDMIIMGRRGLGRLENLFMGSVSNKVSNLADCPVATVK